MYRFVLLLLIVATTGRIGSTAMGLVVLGSETRSWHIFDREANCLFGGLFPGTPVFCAADIRLN